MNRMKEDRPTEQGVGKLRMISYAKSSTTRDFVKNKDKEINFIKGAKGSRNL